MTAPKLPSESRRFVAFVVAGGIAAFANIISRIALSSILSYEVSIVLAYLVGMTTAFMLAKNYVFEKSGRPISSEYVRFSLVNVAALAQVWSVSMALVHLVFPYLAFSWHAETVAHVIGVLSPIATSYYGHKRFSFRQV
jgi:putative flippase GtrA